MLAPPRGACSGAALTHRPRAGGDGLAIERAYRSQETKFGYTRVGVAVKAGGGFRAVLYRAPISPDQQTVAHKAERQVAKCGLEEKPRPNQTGPCGFDSRPYCLY